MILNKKTIWLNETPSPDTYVDFVSDFSISGEEKVYLNIACSGHYAVYLNGELVKFACSSDYPWYRTFDRADITKKCRAENSLLISVWYPGENSQTYIKDEAGLFFSVEQGGKTICESSPATLSRKNTSYKNGYMKTITSQLGFSFYYDAAAENDLAFAPSAESESEREFNLRKTASLILGGRAKAKIDRLCDGYLIDLGEEQVGFLDLELSCAEPQYVKILYAEHLVDGRVQNIIGSRDFSLEYMAKQGKNCYMNPFRRLACRYIQLVCDPSVDVKYAGLRKIDKRVVENPVSFGDSLLQRIYDVSVNTLKKCMHEHYEDCPWREQAMYALDSRNQMLCGYYAFKGHAYQRENLLFIAKGQRADGLLSLCFPTGIDIPIPFFSLAYLLQVRDYVNHTEDKSVLKTLRPTLTKIISAFEKRVGENHLIANLEYPYWNFYEWADESNNEHEITRSPDQYELKYDLILNAMYVYARRIYDALYGEMTNLDEMVNAIHSTFYDQARGVYRLSTTTERSSQLANSMALLIGLGDRALAERIINDPELIKVTLSMNTFYYDALLGVDEGYIDFIVEDMKKKYGKMLDEGATTFWETEKGWVDFDNAGSLCHGWSAIPVYYLSRFTKHN